MKIGYLFLLPLLAFVPPVQADQGGFPQSYTITDKGDKGGFSDFNSGSDFGGFLADIFDKDDGSKGVDIQDKGGKDSDGGDFNFGGFWGKVLSDRHDSGKFNVHDGGNWWEASCGGWNINDCGDGRHTPPGKGDGNGGGCGLGDPTDPTDPNGPGSAVPEPSTWALLLASVVGLAYYRRLRFARR